MTIERTVEIPANHRVYFDVPSHVPVGRARLTVRIDECAPGVGVETVEAFDTEDEATRFTTRLAGKVIHEAWWERNAVARTLRDDGYASKARPVVVVQSDAESAFDSVVLCLLTTFESSRITTRVAITPDETNGLKKPSFVMTEKLVTVDKQALGEKIGVLTGEQMRRIAQQLARVLAIRKENIDD